MCQTQAKHDPPISYKQATHGFWYDKERQNTFQHKECMIPNMQKKNKIQSNTSEPLDPNVANTKKNKIKVKQNTTHQLINDKTHMVFGTILNHNQAKHIPTQARHGS